MIQKCDGVKILDLEEKLEATGSEYIVTAEKDNNYKLPLESVADIVIGSSKFKAAIKDVYESSTPTASVSLDKDKFLFSFGIPAGRTGDAGKDGKDGKDGKVQGMDGNYYEYRFARNNSWETAPQLNAAERYPAGWSSTAPALSSGKVLWATFALINGGDNTLIEQWCDPYYMTGMTGDTGGSGIPGVGYEVRYCKGTETTYTGETWSDSMKWKRNPTGWSTDVPELTSGDEYNYIWFIQCRVIDDSMETAWSKPNPMGGIITPDPVGSQPIAYPMGIYSVSTPYINDGVTAPYVYDTGGDTQGNHYFFLKSVMTWIGTQQNNVSLGTDISGAWEPLKNYEAIYTDLLIAPNSLIGGAVFNNNLMFSQRGKTSSGADSSQYQNINTSDPMNTSNSFRPNFLLDFENGEAYFGAGGIHLAADADNTELELTSSDTKITLDGSGISMINNTSSGALSTVGTYIKKNNISQLTGDYQFKLDSDGMQLGQAQSPFTKWFQVSNNGSMYLNDSLTIGDTSNEHITIDNGSMKLKNSSLQNIIITYDNTTSSITLNNPTGIDSSRVVIKALDDDAEDSISVRAYDSQGNYSSITPTGISSSNGIDKWIIINNGYIAVHTPEGSDTGWTGTKNGLRFQCGICVGTA